MHSTRFHHSLGTPRAAVAALVFVGSFGLAACSDSNDDDGAEPASGGDPARYALNTTVSDTDSSLSYVSLLASLDDQEDIDLDVAREFSGSADIWVFEGSIFVAASETMTITKYAVEENALVEKGKIGFSDYGLTDFGFWVNTFASPTKAYLVNGTSEYVVWNPKTMRITTTVPFPELEAMDGMMAIAGYVDRAAVLRDGKLYHPIYFTDEDIIEFAPSSKIAVIDIESDEIELLDAPCPGLDFASVDESGSIYFSSWIFAPGGAALYDQPQTCVVKLAEGDGAKPELAFNVRDVTDGLDGGAFRYLGDGKALISVLDPTHAEGETDPTEIKYGANWHFWSYDLEARKATEITTIDWNAGAAYSAEVAGKAVILVPADDYADTAVYDLNEGEPKKLFDVRGWAMRLFELD
jgi:hypothetical protein